MEAVIRRPAPAAHGLAIRSIMNVYMCLARGCRVVDEQSAGGFRWPERWPLDATPAELEA
jgi:hypothetical protein